MMLAGLPGKVGDGKKVTADRHAKADGSVLNVDTYVGKAATPDTLKRFLVGPKGCEMTGIAETPDGKALFVNIQHPGENTAAANIGDADQVHEPVASQCRLRRRQASAFGDAGHHQERRWPYRFVIA